MARKDPIIIVLARVWSLLYFNRIADAKQLVAETLRAAGVSQADAMRLAREHKEGEQPCQ